MSQTKKEWVEVMGWVHSNELTRNAARNCATEQMIQDGYEEIGSSDINHIIYGELCFENAQTFFPRIVGWAKELGILS